MGQQTHVIEEPKQDEFGFVSGPFQDMNELQKISEETHYFTLPDGQKVKPIHVKHLGKVRVPTLFPYLLETVAKIPGIKTADRR
jgi:hypothetical protein